MTKTNRDSIIFVTVFLVALWLASGLSQRNTVSTTEVDG